MKKILLLSLLAGASASHAVEQAPPQKPASQTPQKPAPATAQKPATAPATPATSSPAHAPQAPAAAPPAPATATSAAPQQPAAPSPGAAVASPAPVPAPLTLEQRRQLELLANAERIDKANRELLARNQELQLQNENLDMQLNVIRRDKSSEGIWKGALAVIAGFLMGWYFSGAGRRKSSW